MNIDSIDTKKLEKTAFILKTIAHPVRLKIIEVLKDKSMSVNELCEFLQIEQSLTSHHLATMRKKGVLETAREGKKVFYALKMTEVLEVLKCMYSCCATTSKGFS